MRLALVSQEYPPHTAYGGIGSQTHLKAHGLAALGHEVHVLSRNPEPRRMEYLEGAVHVIRIPDFSHRAPIHTELGHWLTYSTEVAAALSDLHAREHLELIDFPEWGCEAYVHLLNRSASCRVPTVIHIHGPLVMFAHAIGWPSLDSDFYRIGSAMEGTCLRLADAVFSSGACSADWCSRHHGLDRSRIPVLHTGVDTSQFSPWPVPKESRPTIVFVGKIARNKGVEVLVEAACRLVADFPDLWLRLLGRGDDPSLPARLRALAGAAGRPSMLDMPGFVDRRDLPVELSRAHVFASPSAYEGGPGFVFLEAMACGLPVVGCSGSGASEAVQSGKTGILVPPGDVDRLASALRRLLSNPEERAAMGQRGRHFAVTEASTATCLKRIEAFYFGVVRAARSGAEEHRTCVRSTSVCSTASTIPGAARGSGSGSCRSATRTWSS